jgi:phosphatidyl-myo-inositol alpha-mannosyltransferase
VIPVGRSVIVPANGSLPNIVLSPSTPFKIKRVLARERFDVLHLHEPMTPAICVATLAYARCPLVATWHAAGDLRLMRMGLHFWGELLDRVDHRIAVSEQARESVEPWCPAEYDVIPNGVQIPPAADPANRENHVVFIGRHDPRKGMPVLLAAWPEVHRRTGARLRLVGADPLAVRLLMARGRVPDAGIDVLGWVSDEELTAELLSARVLTAPSTGQESFGMVLTRSFACATPVVASDIAGYRAVVEPGTGLLVRPGDARALAQALVSLLEDEEARASLGAAARKLAVERYGWPDISRRLAAIYERLCEDAPERAAA